MKRTLLDKIWERHIVSEVESNLMQLYIDRHYCHEVTSPQAFQGLRNRGLRLMRPERTFCIPDHNVPTVNQDQPISDPISKNQVDQLTLNATEFGVTLFPLGHPKHGVVHIIGPENGLTLPGMTIVCGDSHTSTHGAFGSIAFGIGTSEVEMVMATQTLLQSKPKQMRINVNGVLRRGVVAKDVILHIISQLTASGATGYFIEFAGDTFARMNMEERMTVCNMSIEMGARGGLMAPDETTYAYLHGREYAPQGDAWEKAVKEWKELYTDADATFDAEHSFDAAEITPMVTYGTNPGMGMGVNGVIPTVEKMGEASKASFIKSLDYMGFRPGQSLLGQTIDYVFLGSCTNGRIEDFRVFADYVKGHTKHPDVVAWLVPGSHKVLEQIRQEGLDTILQEAGFEIRQPGCSACLAMNEDKVPAGKYAVSTSNRNFEGRQGPGARTLLAGPIVAAIAAVTGKIGFPE